MKVLWSIIVMVLLPFGAFANDEAPAEINYLLESIGNSQCTFVRNGKRYDSMAAEAHLRMKYQRGKRYAPTSEKFIERLASRSSMSRKPYFIECDGEEETPSGEWLLERLAEYRAGPE